MDDQRFDALAKALAGGLTRRRLLAGLAAGGTGLTGLLGGGRGIGAAAQVSQARCGNVTCRTNPGRCAEGCVCCDYGNGNSRCRPPGACSPGTTVCPPERPVLDPARGCVAPPTTTTTTPAPTTTLPPATTTSPPATTTTAAPGTTTTLPPTTTTTPPPGPCGQGETLCNGVCCASPCACLAQTGGGLACANATAPSPRGCTASEGGRCDAGFACIANQCRPRCDPPTPTTSPPPPPPCAGACGGEPDGSGGVCPFPCGGGQSCCLGTCSDAFVIECLGACVQCAGNRNSCNGSCFRDANGNPACAC